MNADLLIVLLMLGAAILMFAVNRPRVDAVALLAMAALPFTGVITVNEAIAGRSRVAPSQLMMPMAYAALISGMMTLVATSPNLVINYELIAMGRKASISSPSRRSASRSCWRASSTCISRGAGCARMRPMRTCS